MNEAEAERQQRLHEAIEEALHGEGVLDGLVLTGWVVCYETAALGEEATAHAGTFYGPREMTTWRALGLVEWARRWSLEPGERGEDE
ncbi:MAG TPA: hypothetical protein VH834_18165 [Solirubrobacteraceae bacterium]